MAQVLIADDDELLRILLRHKLTLAGFDVLLAEDGEKALDLLRDQRPDAVILDAMMPGMDGFEVLRRIRETPEIASTTVVMLTQRSREEDVLHGLSLGAEDYVLKPFLPDELVLRLERLMLPLRRAG